ncbi:hypothetical protein K7432_008926 [Basidiobolus ranarum]
MELKESEIGLPKWMLEYINLEVDLKIFSDHNQVGKVKTLKVQLLKGKLKIPTTEGLEVWSSMNKAKNARLIDWEDKLKRNLAEYPVEKDSITMIKVLDEECIFQVIDIEMQEGDEHTVGFVEREGTQVQFTLGDGPNTNNGLEMQIDSNGYKEQCQELQELIDNLFQNIHLHRSLNISPIRSVLVSGVSGVGKASLVRSVLQKFQINKCELSLAKLLSKCQGTSDVKHFVTQHINLVFEEAILCMPSVILIKDVDLLSTNNNVDNEFKTDLLNSLADHIRNLNDEIKVFVIGVTRDKRKLPEILRKNDVFQHELIVPVPTRLQRISILVDQLSKFPLYPQSFSKAELLTNDVLVLYAEKIALATMGFVGRDLALLCRAAALHAIRKQMPDSTEDNLFNVEQLASFFSRLNLSRDNGDNAGNTGLSRYISWEDFEYALSVTKPSQQVEFESTVPRKYWHEIGGYQTIIDRLRQLIRISITSVESSHFLGVQAPSGLLLYGPSGCGKTALVNALISESTLNVIIVKGPEIFSKYFGETENTIRRIFATARQVAPCVVFFDEIDALGTKREWSLDESGGGVNERVLSTLLNEMDGVSERKGVFVIGCTNRPDKVDDAILRPGRLDQLLYVGYPDIQDRVKILETLARKTPISSELDLTHLATKTDYFSGADLENVIRESAIHALRENLESEEICGRHVEPVLQKMKIGVLQRASDPVMVIYQKFQKR